MESKHKFIIFLVLDLILIIGCVINIGYWFELAPKLKAPCPVCAKENYTVDYCMRTTPNLQYQINLSLMKEFEGEFDNPPIE